MIDLHLHSTASDGTCKPAELIRMAEQLGLSAVALTDHDTVDGLPEFLETARGSSVTAIPGIEFSSAWYGASLHIVGLYIDPDAQSLRQLLTSLITIRDERNLRIIANLQQQGFHITLEDVVAASGGGVVGRPHIAKALTEAGHVRSQKEAFDKLIGHGKPAYVRRRLPLPGEIIDTIHKAGGIAVWAHPLSGGRFSAARMRQVLRVLLPAGLDALEGYYGDYTDDQEKVGCTVAWESNLLVSGGSDFHGGNSPGVQMGIGRGRLSIPDDCLASLAERAAIYRARR
jgi:predicted metal-dependent phosphoesterase TrpH